MTDNEFELLKEYISLSNMISFSNSYELKNNISNLVDFFNKNKEDLLSDKLIFYIIDSNIEIILHYKKMFLREDKYISFLEDAIAFCEKINWEYDLKNCKSTLLMIDGTIRLVLFQQLANEYKKSLEIQEKITKNNCKTCNEERCMFKYLEDNDERFKIDYTYPCDKCTIKKLYPENYYFICKKCKKGIEREDSLCFKTTKDLI